MIMENKQNIDIRQLKKQVLQDRCFSFLHSKNTKESVHCNHMHVIFCKVSKLIQTSISVFGPFFYLKKGIYL